METRQARHLQKRAQWLHESAKRLRSDLLAAGVTPTSEVGIAAGDAFQSSFELTEQLERAATSLELRNGEPVPIRGRWDLKPLAKHALEGMKGGAR